MPKIIGFFALFSFLAKEIPHFSQTSRFSPPVFYKIAAPPAKNPLPQKYFPRKRESLSRFWETAFAFGGGRSGVYFGYEKAGGGSLTDSARRAVYGMALMTAAMQIVPFSDACAKLLTAQYDMPPLQAAWARLVFAALFLLPALPRTKFAAAGRLLRPYFLRGACWAGATAFFFAALKENPLPSALALLFVAPLFVAVAAPLLLGESFSARRIAASAAGFCGVLLVLRPQGGEFSPSLLWALAAGLCYGGYLMAARRGGGLESGAATLMTMCAASVLVAPFALWQWQTPDGAQWALMAAMGGLSAAGHFLITKACECAGASQVAPFNYTEIVGASVASYWFFSELPAPQVYAGVALIAAAGVYVAATESRAP